MYVDMRKTMKDTVIQRNENGDRNEDTTQRGLFLIGI
jgi:hypothetical protein